MKTERIPAHCKHCGLLFPSAIALGPNATGVMKGNVQTCPNCGGFANILDGKWSVVEAGLKLLAGPEATVLVLQRLQLIFQQAQNSEDVNRDQLVEKINESVPHLGALTKLIPQTRSEIYAFLTLILMVISALLSQCSKPGSTEIHHHYHLQHPIEQPQKDNKPILISKGTTSEGVEYEFRSPQAPKGIRIHLIDDKGST